MNYAGRCKYLFYLFFQTTNLLFFVLHRSTNAKEGEILSWCFCEKLCTYIGACDPSQFTSEVTIDEIDASNASNSKVMLKNISRPFIFVTTHFLGLTKLANQYPNVTK
jgi:hypothetical protein